MSNYFATLQYRACSCCQSPQSQDTFLQGTMDVREPGVFFGVARHVYYVTTVLVEKID